jgi:hypothetical protein
MSSVQRQRDLLSLADWDAMPENEFHTKAELVDGVLLVNPPPVSDHQYASGELFGRFGGPNTLDAFRLTGTGYEPLIQRGTGRVQLDAPVALSVDLDALAP